jgi:hypothetical protein
MGHVMGSPFFSLRYSSLQTIHDSQCIMRLHWMFFLCKQETKQMNTVFFVRLGWLPHTFRSESTGHLRTMLQPALVFAPHIWVDELC